MRAAAARIATPHALQYLAGLCGRLGKDAPARLYAGEGFLDLPLGPCHLSALPGSLALVVEAEDEPDLLRLQGLVAEHLRGVAPHDPVPLRWSAVW